MKARAFDVETMFAEPCFRTNIADAIAPEQEHFVKGLAMLDDQVNRISEELYLLERPEMASIRAAVQEALDTYAREVMGISARLEVTRSWSLTNPPGVGMHGHTHSNALVSGSLYYTDLPDPPGNMIFERHDTCGRLEIAVGDTGRNVSDAQRNALVPARGDLVLFPSALEHYVETNTSGVDRHSIAFDTLVRGRPGSSRDVSEPEL